LSAGIIIDKAIIALLIVLLMMKSCRAGRHLMKVCPTANDKGAQAARQDRIDHGIGIGFI
jgi:Na+/H+-translocating membrane pyrophosphatase